MLRQVSGLRTVPMIRNNVGHFTSLLICHCSTHHSIASSSPVETFGG
uniref:Uncharacterized protein n=1 Tax=Anguilla anguilla TaxID=7936 RepID=A0A0E9PEF1_ANGAN